MKTRERKFRCFYGGKMYGNQEALRIMYNIACGRNWTPAAVVMQSSELQDKNKVDIYEEDIVRVEVGNKYMLFSVHFGDTFKQMVEGGYYGWYMRLVGGNYSARIGECCQLNSSCDMGEVIGNTFEHPHLIEQK